MSSASKTFKPSKYLVFQDSPQNEDLARKGAQDFVRDIKLLGKKGLRVVPILSGDPGKLFSEVCGGMEVMEGADDPTQQDKQLKSFKSYGKKETHGHFLAIMGEFLQADCPDFPADESSKIKEFSENDTDVSTGRMTIEHLESFKKPVAAVKGSWNVKHDSLNPPTQKDDESDKAFSERLSSYKENISKLVVFDGAPPAGANGKALAAATGRQPSTFQVNNLYPIVGATDSGFDGKKRWLQTHFANGAKVLQGLKNVLDAEQHVLIDDACEKIRAAHGSVTDFLTFELAPKAEEIQESGKQNPLVGPGVYDFFSTEFEAYQEKNSAAALLKQDQDLPGFFRDLGLSELTIGGKPLIEFLDKKGQLGSLYRIINTMPQFISSSACCSDMLVAAGMSAPLWWPLKNIGPIVKKMCVEPPFRKEQAECWKGRTLFVDCENDDKLTVLFFIHVMFADPDEVITLESLERQITGYDFGN